MKRTILTFGMTLLLGAMAQPMNAQVSNDNEDEVYKIARPQAKDFVPGQVLFKLKDGHQANVRRAAGHFQSAGITKLDKVLTEFGAQDVEQLLPRAKVTGTPRRAKAYNGETIVERDLTQLYKVTLPEEKAMQTLELVEQLKQLDEVEFAEPNYKVYLTGTTNLTNGTNINDLSSGDHVADSYNGNPMVSQQWYLDAYGVKELWNKPIINPTRPVIAILDTGVDITHPDLKDNIWSNTAEAEGEANYDNDGNGFMGDVHGWDFINGTANIRDYNSHGTHVAGIAAASNNGIGIVGANPRALIMPVTVMQSDGTGDVATIIKGADYAVANGATILNLSLGTYTYSLALRQTLEKVYQTAIIVAAAGNSAYSIYFNPFYPAAFSFVLGVMAIDQYGRKAGFSNYDDDGPIFSSISTFRDPEGLNYEIKAPGVDILSTIPGGKYKELCGTSMATPLVAGAISALKMVKEYDTQEILWGDLLHTNNIAEAYALTQRPAELDFLKLQFRERKELTEETENDYSGDGRIDIGETVRIYPVIRTTFGEASNIKMHLEMGDEFEDPSTVEIITDKNNIVDFGWHLDVYGKGVSANPLIFKVSDNVADNRHVKLKIVATCDESTKAFEKPFTIVVDNMIKIGGRITKETTLTADHVYFVSQPLMILNGAKLIIEPGTRLEFGTGNYIATENVTGKYLIANGTKEKPITFTRHIGSDPWIGHIGAYQERQCRDTITYCILDGFYSNGLPYMEDCIVDLSCSNNNLSYLGGKRINVINGNTDIYYTIPSEALYHSNIVNNAVEHNYTPYSSVGQNNYFNNYFIVKGENYLFSSDNLNEYSETPPYLGSGKEDVVRSLIYNPTGYNYIDLSNMPTHPFSEAHGIVWKVVVNGYDAQDEYDQLPPLGVSKHKFEVYFNRPMNKAVKPKISFGVRDPWTQNAVAEDGSWNVDGTIYTVYKTITGKTKSDGINRIYVYGAEDNEFFEIPYEKSRFNINVQAAGSMATGFMAEAGLGRVNLSWDNTNNNFDDAMGFNIYRYTYVEKDSLDRWGYPTGVKIIVPDTIRINTDIVDIEATEYTDYDVTPGETYYYLYKVLSTDLQEYDVSNVVAATPMTSTLGDANGSGDVDVADVITTVNYAAGIETKPFIFEAADMNADLQIDILDVIGIIQKILHPTAGARIMSEATAVYTIEDGVLYVESPVALAGVQVQLSLEERGQRKEERVANDLDGFEHTSAWLTDNDYLFLAYNMNGKVLSPGKHALLYIGNADLSSLRLSDAQGANVMAIPGEATLIKDAMGSKVMNAKGVYNLNGQKVTGNADTKLRKGVYIIDGQKIVK